MLEQQQLGKVALEGARTRFSTKRPVPRGKIRSPTNPGRNRTVDSMAHM
jgi:hypothetical protein